MKKKEKLKNENLNENVDEIVEELEAVEKEIKEEKAQEDSQKEVEVEKSIEELEEEAEEQKRLEALKDFKSKKFLLTGKNIKIYERDILNPEGVLAPYGVSFEGLDVIEKIYFDTVDRFFFSRGIIINLVKSKLGDKNKIVVRLEGEDKRIPFVRNMPKSLTLEIDKKDFFSAHFDFIAKAILDIMPAGLNVDIKSYVSTIIPVFVVIKKSSLYRVINNNGLKMEFSFENVNYTNNANRNWYKLMQFEMRLLDKTKEELFDKFIKRLILQVPTIIPMKDSDLLNGLDYTSKTGTDKNKTASTKEKSTDEKSDNKDKKAPK